MKFLLTITVGALAFACWRARIYWLNWKQVSAHALEAAAMWNEEKAVSAELKKLADGHSARFQRLETNFNRLLALMIADWHQRMHEQPDLSAFELALALLQEYKAIAVDREDLRKYLQKHFPSKIENSDPETVCIALIDEHRQREKALRTPISSVANLYNFLAGFEAMHDVKLPAGIHLHDVEGRVVFEPESALVPYTWFFLRAEWHKKGIEAPYDKRVEYEKVSVIMDGFLTVGEVVHKINLAAEKLSSHAREASA